MKPACYNKMNELERKLFDSVENSTLNKPALSKNIQAGTGIKRRTIAAEVRRMNEKYKGYFFIGSLREGYWLCKDREEAVESVLGYNRIIMSMLGERKRMKGQIDETFPPKDKNLFGEQVDVDTKNLINTTRQKMLYGKINMPVMDNRKYSEG